MSLLALRLPHLLYKGQSESVRGKDEREPALGEVAAGPHVQQGGVCVQVVASRESVRPCR